MKAFALFISAGLFVQAQNRPPQGEGPEAGRPAPSWKLKTQDGKKEVDLSKLKGKPVVLIFGSYT